MPTSNTLARTSDWNLPCWISEMTDERSVIKKTESALDDLADLWRRRKLVCTIVSLVIVLPTAFTLYQQFVAVPRLKGKITSLLSAKEQAERARDKAEVQLAPFLAVANRQFPDEPQQKRLELLLTRLDKVVARVEDAANKIPQRRSLSEESHDRIAAVLKQGSPFSVRFNLCVDSSEAIALARSLQSIFRLAGWPSVGPIDRTIRPVPPQGLQIEVSETPDASVQKALAMILDELNYPKAVKLQTGLPPGTMSIVIGAQ